MTSTTPLRYNMNMKKRYIDWNGDKRPLCIGDENTCVRMADYKEVRAGSRRYHTKCWKHRRPEHNTRSMDNPKSKRYIPLDFCSLCGGEDNLERHRIQRGMPYTPRQVIVLCKQHHDMVHKFEKVINDKHFHIRRDRILKESS